MDIDFDVQLIILSESTVTMFVTIMRKGSDANDSEYSSAWGRKVSVGNWKRVEANGGEYRGLSPPSRIPDYKGSAGLAESTTQPIIMT